ncbi:MAG: hypothetical protein ACJAZ5_002878 [Alloalcanivorax venustensis]|jgi:hypothetical protein
MAEDLQRFRKNHDQTVHSRAESEQKAGKAVSES